jgi:hypothetical protein
VPIDLDYVHFGKVDIGAELVADYNLADCVSLDCN